MEKLRAKRDKSMKKDPENRAAKGRNDIFVVKNDTFL
jgi:hypothetical protein